MRVLFYKRVCHTHTCVNTVRTLPLNSHVKLYTHMLIPKLKQTLFGNGDSPYGNIRVSLPISVR